MQEGRHGTVRILATHSHITFRLDVRLMNSDPPSLLAGSELRDISFRPTNIHDAPITIVHPQLRDLILPIQRGRVLFPHGTDISEMTWEPQQDEDDDEEEAGGMDVERVRSASRKPPVSAKYAAPGAGS